MVPSDAGASDWEVICLLVCLNQFPDQETHSWFLCGRRETSKISHPGTGSIEHSPPQAAHVFILPWRTSGTPVNVSMEILTTQKGFPCLFCYPAEHANSAVRGVLRSEGKIQEGVYVALERELFFVGFRFFLISLWRGNLCLLTEKESSIGFRSVAHFGQMLEKEREITRDKSLEQVISGAEAAAVFSSNSWV